MIVQLCYRTNETASGKIKVKANLTLREARRMFKEQLNNSSTQIAYIRYFDGWRYVVKEILKKGE